MQVQPVSLFKKISPDFKPKQLNRISKPLNADSTLFTLYSENYADRFESSEIRKSTKNNIRNSAKLQKKLDKLFSGGLDKCTFEEKLNAFGIETALDENGKLILSEYRQPADDITFEDIGVNEDELLKRVSLIFGNADFTGSKAISSGSVKVIGGDIIF